MRRSVEYLQRPELKGHFKNNLTVLLCFVMSDYVIVARRSEGLGFRKLAGYFAQSRKYIRSLKGSDLYASALLSLARAQAWLAWILLKQKILAIAPRPLVRAFYAVRAFLHRQPLDRSLAKI